MSVGRSTVAIGDRHPTIPAERFRRDPDPGRGLAALVLGQIDEPHDLAHELFVEARLHQLGRGEVLLHVGEQHGIEHVVGGSDWSSLWSGRNSAEGGLVSTEGGMTGAGPVLLRHEQSR